MAFPRKFVKFIRTILNRQGRKFRVGDYCLKLQELLPKAIQVTAISASLLIPPGTMVIGTGRVAEARVI